MDHKKQACLLLLSCTLALHAKPQGGISKNAIITDEGNTLTIKSGKQGIVEWESFSLQQNERIQFLQASADAAILNRVKGTNLSEIYGAIQSNGKVLLINPNGIVIGPSGEIDTNGFLVSTLDILDADFLSNRLLFSGESHNAIVNLGRITCQSGDLLLFARHIENQGALEAPNGLVGAANGTKILVQPDGEQRIFIESNYTLTSPDQMIDNQGTIDALAVELKSNTPYFLAVRNSGRISANQVKEQGGRIYLVGEMGRTEVGGTLEAPGGDIGVIGAAIEIDDTARIDVSSDKGGGRIRIGGDERGKNPNFVNSMMTYVAEGAEIHADSLTNGDAGTIVIYADGDTQCYGTISARAYGEKGAGGYVEVSGIESITVPTHPDLRSAEGKWGTFLIDPGAVLITAGSDSGPDTFGSDYINTQLASGNLTISTSDGTLGNTEVLTVDGTATINWSQNTKLTLIGRDSVIVNATIINSNNSSPNFEALEIQGNQDGTLPATGTANGISFSDTIALQTVNGDIILKGKGGSGATTSNARGISFGTCTIQATGTGANGGSISITGTGGPGTNGNHGVLGGPTITTGDGDIAITATNLGTGTNQSGLFFDFGSITSTGGDITLNGTSGEGSGDCDGIRFISVDVETTSGTISLSGTSIANSTSNGVNVGVSLTSSSITSLSTGPIVVNGTGGVGTLGNSGVKLVTSTIDGLNGNISVTGTAGSASSSGSGASLYGVDLNTTSRIRTNGDGDITIVATSGSGVTACHGLRVNSSTIQTTNSDIHVTGTGGTASTSLAFGVALEASGIITAVTDGRVTVIGNGGTTAGGAGGSTGVSVTGANALIHAGNNNLTVTGTAGPCVGPSNGISVSTGGKITSGVAGGPVAAPIVTITGTGGAANSSGGIVVRGTGAAISAVQGTINITGNATGMGVVGNTGISVSSAGSISLSGNPVSLMTINGTGAPLGTTGNHGVFVSDVNSAINLIGGGSMIINGTAGGTSSGNSGIFVTSSARINGSGLAGTLTLNGTGNVGSDCYGVKINGSPSFVAAANPKALVINGTAGSSSSLAIGIIGSGRVGNLTTPNGLETINTLVGDLYIATGGRIIGEGPGIVVNVARDLTIEPASASSGIFPNSGNATITVGRDLNLTNTTVPAGSGIAVIGSIGSLGTFVGNVTFPSIGRDVNLSPSNWNAVSHIGHTLLGPASITFTGNITFNSIGGNLNMQGATTSAGILASGRAQIGHSCAVNGATYGGNITINCAGDINVLGGSANSACRARIGHGGLASATVLPSTQLLIANRDINIVSSVAQAEVVNGGGPLTLVVDNAFPNFPTHGPGKFVLGSTLTASGTLKIYTSQQSQNTINDLINGEAYVPAPTNVDANNQFWDIYYPNGPVSGGAFTLYYKVGRLLDLYLSNIQLEALIDLSIANAQLNDLLPLNSYLRLMTLPIYRSQLCERRKKTGREYCQELFQPYDVDFMSDNVYRN